MLKSAIAVPDVISASGKGTEGPIKGEGALVGPGATGDGQGVTGSTCNQELPALLGGLGCVAATGDTEGCFCAAVQPIKTGEVINITGAECEAVGTAASQINRLNRVDA